jgi:hypothetical protein
MRLKFFIDILPAAPMALGLTQPLTEKVSIFLTQYCAGGQIEKNEIGGACGAYGGGERGAQGIGGENLRERSHWGDPHVDVRKILRWIFRKLEGVVGTGWSWLRIGTGGGHL